jgi:hypothetical protein
MYFTKDTARHRGSMVKLYKKVGKTLKHMGDIDEMGNLMRKHKSPDSITLYLKDFIGIK